MNKESYIDMREPLINTSPLYNPMGNSEGTEFSDEKNYSQMMNHHTEEGKKKREKEKTSRLRKNATVYMDDSQENEKMELMSMLAGLRQDAKGELDAIQLYESHIQSFKTPEIKEKLIEIVNEERHHFNELSELIDKYQKFYGDFKEV